MSLATINPRAPAERRDAHVADNFAALAPFVGPTGQLTLQSYTVAAAPSAAAAGAGAMIYVTNGNAGSACLAVSDGQNWKSIAFGATISAS